MKKSLLLMILISGFLFALDNVGPNHPVVGQLEQTGQAVHKAVCEGESYVKIVFIGKAGKDGKVKATSLKVMCYD